MTFAHHDMLWAAGAVPVLLLLLFFYDRAVRRRLTNRLGELPVIGKVMATASPRRRVIKLAIVMVATALLLVAAARPQIAGKRRA